jgi:protoporphyrinogen/coproporphyrinogen III oxidase
LAKDAIFPQNTSPAARNRYLYYPDHLVCMPHPSFGFFNNLSTILNDPIFEGLIWGSVTEIFKDKRGDSVQDESIGDFFERRLGRKAVDRLISGLLHGIYAGDIWQLSIKSLFPVLWRDEKEAGSVILGMMKSRTDGMEVTKREGQYLQAMKDFQWDPLLRDTLRETVAFTFRDGLAMLSDGLVRYLMGTGKVNFQTSSAIKSIKLSEKRDSVEVRTASSKQPSTYTNVISALSPQQLNALHSDSSTRLIPEIPSVTVMTVNLYFRTPDMNPPGFGYLIPQGTPFENNPERALGVIFDTAYSPSPADVDVKNWHINDAEQLKQARESGQLVNVHDFSWYNLPEKPNLQDHVKERGTKLTVMLGGHYWDDWPAYPDEQEGLSLAKSLLERHLGIKEEPEAWQVNLQRDCIPQYTVGHEQRLKSAHSNLSRAYSGRLRVAGNWMFGVGVNDCLRSAWEVARALRDGKSGTGLEHVGTDEYVRLKPIRPGQRDETQ